MRFFDSLAGTRLGAGFPLSHFPRRGIVWGEKSNQEGITSMYAPCNNNCNSCGNGGFFGNYQAFWIIVVIAIVVIWVHYGACGNNCCGRLNCGCENNCNPCC